MMPVHVDSAPLATAPDGSSVHVLVATGRGSMAQFTLPPGAVSRAVVHRTVDEVWYILAGHGRMWLRDSAQETFIELLPGISISIPFGTAFQFRAAPDAALQVIGVTMPPWPGEQEAVPASGPWEPAV